MKCKDAAGGAFPKKKKKGGVIYDTILKDPSMRAFEMPCIVIVADLAIF